MASFDTASNQLKREDFFDAAEFESRVARLRSEFPEGSIHVMNSGTRLFHMSRNADKLLTDQRFDPTCSFQHGAFSFSLISAEELGQIVITTNKPLVLFNRDIIKYHSEWSKRVKSGPSNLCSLPMAEGFEGEIVSTKSVVAGGKEIIIFPNGLGALNNSIARFQK